MKPNSITMTLKNPPKIIQISKSQNRWHNIEQVADVKNSKKNNINPVFLLNIFETDK